jgi:phosphoenolpyruvate carboxylase
MLRYSKLTVADEIENALSYYRITFLRELPGLYDDIEPTSPRITATAAAAGPSPRAYVQMGSWIGGDRDGNPTSTRTADALTRQATTILDFYLERRTLGAELSMSTLMVACSRRCRRWPRRRTPPTTAPTSPTAAP